MAVTRPTGEQLRFVSAKTGEHILDLYLEAAEKGGRMLPDLLEDVFTDAGQLRSDLIEWRIDADVLQARFGEYTDPEAGWYSISNFLRDRGTFAIATPYYGLDIVSTLDSDVWLVTNTPVSDPLIWYDEAEFKADPRTRRLLAPAAVGDARTAAETARTGAETARTGAETARTGAEDAQSAAETAQTGAETAQTGAQTARDTALTHRTAAETARSDAETAQTAAETAQTGAETAQTGAETARTGAELARNDATTNQVPVGAVARFAGVTPPPGWLEMDGQTITAVYPELRTYLIAEGEPWGNSGGDPLVADIAPADGLITCIKAYGAVIVQGTQNTEDLLSTIATEAQAVAGTDNTHLMTPLRSAQGITGRLATFTDAEAGTDNVKLSTPLRVFQAIARWVTNSPASAAEATAGTNNNKLMTPLRTKEAIIALAPEQDLSPYVEKAGSTMTGHLSVLSPTSTAHAARKDYVDGGLNGRVAKTGDTMTGSLAIDASLTIRDGSMFFDKNGTKHFWMRNAAAGDENLLYGTSGEFTLRHHTPGVRFTYLSLQGDDVIAHGFSNPYAVPNGNSLITAARGDARYVQPGNLPDFMATLTVTMLGTYIIGYMSPAGRAWNSLVAGINEGRLSRGSDGACYLNPGNAVGGTWRMLGTTGGDGTANATLCLRIA